MAMYGVMAINGSAIVKENNMYEIIRKGGKITVNGKLVYDFRKETGYTISGAANKVAKRLAKILGASEYKDLNSDGTPYKKSQG